MQKYRRWDDLSCNPRAGQLVGVSNKILIESFLNDYFLEEVLGCKLYSYQRKMIRENCDDRVFRELLGGFAVLNMRLKKRKRLKLCYFSYPYSRDPKECSEDIRVLVEQLFTELRPDLKEKIVPFVPHWAFDAIMGFPTGYSDTTRLLWEIEIISRCDLFVWIPEHTGAGVEWERRIAESLGVRVLTFDQLVRDGV